MGRRGGPILIAVGLLQLVLGAGFVIALGSVPYAGGGMILTGAILGVVGIALFTAILVAATMGALLPTALDRLGFDPAVASGPILSAANDITGIVIYFSLAAAILRKM